jgi:hypothetical protein
MFCWNEAVLRTSNGIEITQLTVGLQIAVIVLRYLETVFMNTFFNKLSSSNLLHTSYSWAHVKQSVVISK